MKKLLKVMAAAACVFSLTACGSSSEDTIVVGCEELTGTFSPLYYTSSYDGYVVELTYNKLMEYDYDGNLQPALAESADVSEDGKSITFHLRKDVKFSDGTTFDANDVEFTFKVLTDPSYTGRFGAYTQYVVGAAAYRKGETDKLEGITVIDENTIKFDFTEARNDNLTTIVGTGIVSYDQFKDSYAYKNTKPLEKAMGTPVGTGPYVLKDWESGSGASLVKNENYWGEGYEGVNNIVIKPTKMETEYQELESKTVDMLLGMIEPKKIGPATNNDDLALNYYPRGGMGFITYNTASGATSDLAVRQALTYAFDRQSFVDSYYECADCKDLDGVSIGYVPTTYNNPISKLGDVISGAQEVEGLETYDYNIEKAKQILDDAGWKVGASGFREKDGQTLEIKVLSIKDHDILNNLIPMWQKAWGEELKANVKVATVDFNTLLSKIYADKSLDEWNLFFLATSYTSDSMSDIYTTFHSAYAKENNDNYARLMDPALDDLMEQAIREMDEEKAVEKWIEAQKRINEDCSVVPVYGNTYFDIYNKKIKNFKTSALYDWTKALKDVTIE